MATPRFSSLKPGEKRWIEQNLQAAQMFVEQNEPTAAKYGITLTSIDNAFASWLHQDIQDTQEINLVINMVGVWFGQFLVDQAGFAWTISEQAGKTDLAVLALPGEGDVLIYPANFIAKRWERKETNFLAPSFENITSTLAKAKSNNQSPRQKPKWKFW